MNILILSNKVPYPPNDGGAYATLNMLLGLNNAGAKVTLVAMCTPKHDTPKHNLPQWLRNKIEIETVYVDTSISYFNAIINLLFSLSPYNAQRFISAKYKKVITSILKDNIFDIVQLEGPYLKPYIKTIRKYHNGQIALRAHNVEWEIWKRSALSQENILKRWYFTILARRIKRLEKKILDLIDILVPISLRDSEKLYEMGYIGQSFVCPTGYDIDKKILEEVDFEFPSIFHLGGLDWIPNQEGIIWFLENCWPLIKSQLTQVKFYVAGRNASPDFINKINSYPGVVYSGEVSNSAEFMRSKALMIVPLLSGSGMRIKIVEGMSLGKAIISTSIGAEGIEANRGVDIEIADIPEQFAHKTIELLTNKQQTIEMGRNAQRFAFENLDNNKLTQNLFDYYKGVIG
jgi:glycosyltransferase involved in cell wall biosynthesis